MIARVATSRVGDQTVFHLFDDSTGASASILPAYGFNLFDLRLPLAGQVRPIVVAEPDWAAHPGRPARSGFPILFPFAGRIRDAHFQYGGRQFALVPNKPPHSIHGFAYDVPWDVVDHSANPDGATLCGRFRISKNAPHNLDRWPADAILEVRYTLGGSRLCMAVEIKNPSDRTLPWGFGLHSYFALPFDRRGDLTRTRLSIPADDYWVLKESLPTGERLPVDSTPFDFRGGRSMQGLVADLALTGLADAGDDGSSCCLRDDEVGAELELKFDAKARHVVVFTPPGSPSVVAVEPYTAMADPFWLRDRGVDPGIRELLPGGSERLEFTFESRG